jgi:hypothetical protein
MATKRPYDPNDPTAPPPDPLGPTPPGAASAPTDALGPSPPGQPTSTAPTAARSALLDGFTSSSATPNASLIAAPGDVNYRYGPAVGLAADGWVESIGIAASKGDHRPARDLLFATKVVDPPDHDRGKGGVTVIIGATDDMVKVAVQVNVLAGPSRSDDEAG